MLLLVVVGPLVLAAHRVWGLPRGLVTQFEHVRWEGMTLWDLIMPCFIFMCGVSVPYALTKRKVRPWGGWAYWRHVLGRVALLWILGMAVQGNLLTLDFHRISPYNNTLQTIAAGYLIAASVLLVPWRWLRWSAPVLLAAVYGVLLACFGDMTPEGNFAIAIERCVLPVNQDGYSWVLTTLMFGAMTLCGCHCAQLLRSEWPKGMKVVALGGVGILLLCLGWGLTPWVPAVKRIFTVSFASQAMGWCVLALATLYFVVDVLGLCVGVGVVTLFGQNALLAYLCEELFHPAIDALASILTAGVPHWLGAETYPFVRAVTNVYIIIAILAIRQRLRTTR